ncbi:MAG: symmetrical bis(5'-nucleosyl)-tetraphosphatase, partial [bacterium]
MNTYVIGDLQGCHRPLLELIARIDATSPDSTLIFAGDLVNRGPDSLATLRTVIGLGDRAKTVLGNHDLHLLAVSQGIRKMHRTDTLDDILQAPDREALLDWVRRQPLAILQDGHLLMHAGVVPQWSAAQTLAL